MQTAKRSVRGIDLVKLGITAIYGFCIGFFLAARFQAFLMQAWGIGFNSIFVWAFALVLMTASLVSSRYIDRLCTNSGIKISNEAVETELSLMAASLALYRRINGLWTDSGKKVSNAAIVTVFSLIICQVLSRLVIDRAVLGAELDSGLIFRIIMAIGAALFLSLFLIAVCQAFAEAWTGFKNWIKTLTLKDLYFALGVLVVLNALSVIYTKNSSTIYFWDNAGYWENAQNLTEYSQNGIVAVLSGVYESILSADYNNLVALPFVPIFKLFGSSRLVFILTIVNLYLFPLLLLIYGIARSISKRALVAALCVICSLPMLFYLSVLGFVDVAGTFFALAAVFLCLYTGDSKKQSFGRYVFAGCFLAIALLLRRWYVFFALSLLLSQLVTDIIFRKTAAPFLWTAGSFAALLLFFFQPMVSRILLANYAAAYSSYSMDIQTDFMLLFRYFGIFTLALSLLSFFLCLRKKRLRHNAVFVLLQAVSCFALFTFIQTHGQQHLLLYIPALVLALITFFSLFLEYASRHKPVLAAVVLTALLPLLSPFLPREQPSSISEIRTAAVLPSFSYSPPTRADAGEVVRLVRYLDEAVGEKGKTVGVLASSFILNDDILKKSEASLSLPRTSDVPRDYILTLPAVDSRDSFPGALFDCDYLLVANPVQLHLGEENQKVVAIPAEEVLNARGFGAAFSPTGEVFLLGDGSISVRLYERTREVTPDERDALIAAVEPKANISFSPSM